MHQTKRPCSIKFNAYKIFPGFLYQILLGQGCCWNWLKDDNQDVTEEG